MKRIEVITECEKKLNTLKQRYQNTLSRPLNKEKSTEMFEMASKEEALSKSITFRSKYKNSLIEIEKALNRIKDGNFGYCEITGEFIEEKRLLAMPWARVSMKAMDSNY